MAPPESAEAVVMVLVGIGEAMVMAMETHPLNGPLLAAEGTAEHQNIPQPAGHLEGPVGKKAVVTHGDPQATCDPVEHQEGEESGQVPEAGQKSQPG